MCNLSKVVQKKYCEEGSLYASCLILRNDASHIVLPFTINVVRTSAETAIWMFAAENPISVSEVLCFGKCVGTLTKQVES